MIKHNTIDINISLLTDFGFKKLLGSEENRDILIGFLNALLEDEPIADPIISVELLNTEQQGEKEDRSRFIFDIHCQTRNGRRIVIEMQRKQYPDFRDRMTVYSARCVLNQLEKRRTYFREQLHMHQEQPGWPVTLEDVELEHKLRRDAASYHLDAVYVIAVCDFVIDPQRPYPKLSEGRCDLRTGKLLDDRQRFIYVQLPYFKKPKAECNTAFDCWLYTFKNLPTMRENPFEVQRDVFDKLLEKARRYNLTQKEEEDYFRQLDIYSVNMGVEEQIRIDAREKGLAEGRERGLAEGREKGLAEGREKGLAEGRERGLAEGLEQGFEEGSYMELSNNVRSMRNAGLDNETIAKFLNKKIELIAAI